MPLLQRAAVAALVLGSLVLAGHLSAQVELKSATDDSSVVVMAVKNGRAMQDQAGQLCPILGAGKLEFAPAGQFAEIEGAVQAFQVVEVTRPSYLYPEGTLRVNFDLILTMEGPVQDLYYGVAWVVDGQVTKTRIGSFSDLKEAGELIASRWFEIKPAERNGHLRAYVFKAGKSLAGVKHADKALAPFKSKLDALDFAGAREWLGSAAPSVMLPDYLLVQVAQSGDAALLEKALDRMAPKGFNRNLAAPLLRAAASAGRLDCVQVLLRRKVDPNNQDNRGDTALNHALRNGDKEVIKALLAAGANQPEFTQLFREKMLDIALSRNDIAAAKLLLDHQFKWPSRLEQETILAYAVRNDRKEAVEFMLQNRVKPDAKSSDVPVVMIAAGIEDGEILAMLIKAGAKVDVADENNATPCMMAAWRGATKSLTMLRAAGAPVFKADKKQRTPAAWATMGGHSELAMALLAEHPLAGREEARVLHDAILKEDAKVIQATLQQGATLDPKADDFAEVLAKALQDNRSEVFKQGWPKGFSANPPVYEGWNLAGVAQRLGRTDILAWVQEKTGQAPEVVMPKPQKLPVEIVRRGAGLTPEAVGEDVIHGEAKIDLFIDSAGVARFPVIRSAAPESLGPAAVKLLVGSQFSEIGGGAKPWRRVIVPVIYSQENFSRDEIVDAWSQDVAPVRLNAPEKTTVMAADPGSEQAVWVRYQVSATGKVVAPRVLCTTDEKQNGPALEWLRGLRYLPAKKDEREVWAELTGIVLMPSGVLLEVGDMVSDRVFSGSNQTAPVIWDRAYYESATRKDIGKNKSRGVAVMQFLVDRDGAVKNIRTLATSDSDLARKAKDQCASYHFKPGKIDGKPVETTMTRVIVVGEVSDIMAISETRIGF